MTISLELGRFSKDYSKAEILDTALVVSRFRFLRVVSQNLYTQYHSGLFLVGTININETRKQPVLNAGTESGPGIGWGAR